MRGQHAIRRPLILLTRPGPSRAGRPEAQYREAAPAAAAQALVGAADARYLEVVLLYRPAGAGPAPPAPPNALVLEVQGFEPCAAGQRVCALSLFDMWPSHLLDVYCAICASQAPHVQTRASWVYVFMDALAAQPHPFLRMQVAGPVPGLALPVVAPPPAALPLAALQPSAAPAPAALPPAPRALPPLAAAAAPQVTAGVAPAPAPMGVPTMAPLPAPVAPALAPAGGPAGLAAQAPPPQAAAPSPAPARAPALQPPAAAPAPAPLAPAVCSNPAACMPGLTQSHASLQHAWRTHVSGYVSSHAPGATGWRHLSHAGDDLQP